MITGPGYKIEKATDADANRLSELVNSAYRGDYAKQGWTTEADILDGTRTDADALREVMGRPGTTVLKYVEGERLLGCVELAIEEKNLYLGMLTVEPGLQGKGIGKLLLKASESIAAENHCRKIYITVITIRKELIEWYQRHGYVDTGK